MKTLKESILGPNPFDGGPVVADYLKDLLRKENGKWDRCVIDFHPATGEFVADTAEAPRSVHLSISSGTMKKLAAAGVRSIRLTGNNVGLLSIQIQDNNPIRTFRLEASGAGIILSGSRKIKGYDITASSINLEPDEYSLEVEDCNFNWVPYNPPGIQKAGLNINTVSKLTWKNNRLNEIIYMMMWFKEYEDASDILQQMGTSYKETSTLKPLLGPESGYPKLRRLEVGIINAPFGINEYQFARRGSDWRCISRNV